MIYECADCGITPIDLPSPWDNQPELFFEVQSDGRMLCQGCELSYE